MGYKVNVKNDEVELDLMSKLKDLGIEVKMPKEPVKKEEKKKKNSKGK